MPVYKSARLSMLVKRWANNNHIKAKVYLNPTSQYRLKYKELINQLIKQPQSFKFNNQSIDQVLRQHLKINRH